MLSVVAKSAAAHSRSTTHRAGLFVGARAAHVRGTMKTKGPIKLRVNKETLLVLASKELAQAAGGVGEKVHCCSRWTDTASNGPSTTSGSVMM